MGVLGVALNLMLLMLGFLPTLALNSRKPLRVGTFLSGRLWNSRLMLVVLAVAIALLVVCGFLFLVAL